MAPETFEQLLDRAAAAHGIEPGFWDIWGHYHDTTAGRQAGHPARHGVRRRQRGELERSLAARDPPRMGAPGCRPPSSTGESDSVELAAEVPAERLGERAHIAIRREDGAVHRIRSQPAGPAADRLRRNGRPHLGAQTGAPRRCACRSAITKSPRGWAAPRGADPLHRDARSAPGPIPHLGRGGRAAGIAISLYGVRSGRNWGCGDFRDLMELVDWAADDLRRQLHRPQPAARHPQPAPVQHQPLSAQLHLLSELHLSRYRGHGGFRALPARAALRALAGGGRRNRRAARAPFRGIRARGRAQVALSEAAVRAVPAGVAARLGARPRVPRPSPRAKGDLLERFATYCALDEHLHRRNPDLWVWTEWPAALPGPGIRRRRASSARSTGAR